MGEKRGMQALEAWCRQVTAGYNGVNITNMTSSWRDGLAFCALIHHFRPDLIDFDSLNADNIYHNNNLAFTIAEQKLGIPALLDPEDMVKFIPDRLSIMTYLSQFFQVLAASKTKGDGKKMNVNELSQGTNSSINSLDTADVKRTPEKLAKEFARQLPVERRSPRTSDLCDACHNPVFLAERLMVNGRLRHRVCFRCARCNSQLNLANYYETEAGQYCCETCPDEVKNATYQVELSAPCQENEKTSECVMRVEAEPLQERYSVNSVEKKLFLESLVSDTADTSFPAFIDDTQPSAAETLELCQETTETTYEQLELLTKTACEEISVPPKGDKTSEDVSLSGDIASVADETSPCNTSIENEEASPRESVDSSNEKSEYNYNETFVEPISQEVGPSQTDQTTFDEDDEKAGQVNEAQEKAEGKPEEKVEPIMQIETSRKIESDDYPEDLNPFDEDSEEDGGSFEQAYTSSGTSPKKLIPAPKISLNPFESDDDEYEETLEKQAVKIPPERPPPPRVLTIKPSPSPKKRPAPAPPTALSPASQTSSPTLSERMGSRRRKSAPPPPPPADDPHQISSDETPSLEKAKKEIANLQTQALNKDMHGQWKRKKGPAPPRPLPQKRHLRKLPVQSIQQELNDIEIKQLELERQGVSLEQNIRAITESDDCETSQGGPHVEEMILQLFDLVNEKNELLRRQSELMCIRRQQRLEEEHAELEFQIRCLMEKPAAEKRDEDLLKEEELIERLVQVVHRRAEIVDCLELDRRRQAEEDESIQKHLDDFNTRHNDESSEAESKQAEQPKKKSHSLKAIHAPIKLLKKEKIAKLKKKKGHVNNEEDSESLKGKPSTSDQPSEDHTDKDTEKKRTKSWFKK